MAIFRPGPIVGAISGAVGGVQFATGSRGPIVRSRPRRTKQHSKELLSRRAALRRCQNVWQTLTHLEYLAWRTQGYTTLSSDALGVRRTMTAYQCFLFQNLAAAQFGFAIVTTPRNKAIYPVMGTPLFDFTAGGAYNIKTPDAYPISNAALFFASRPHRAYETNTFKNYRHFATRLLSAPAWLDLSTWYDPVFGAPAAGEYTSIRIRIGSGATEVWPFLPPVDFTVIFA